MRSYEWSPDRLKRIKRNQKHQEERWAKRSGPVTSRRMTPEERERYQSKSTQQQTGDRKTNRKGPIYF